MHLIILTIVHITKGLITLNCLKELIYFND